MRTRVVIGEQVELFLKSLSPEPRRALRAALHALERNQGDVKPLEGKLASFWRLRAGSYRVIFEYGMNRGHRLAICIFAERRSVVYETFVAGMD